MYTVTIRDHMMIAHSLPAKAFGPAQHMHGATYVVDAEFKSEQLDENNIVIDIDIATKKLQQALAPLKYQNLDELAQFKGKLTTTEFLAHYIHQQISDEIKDSFTGSLKITLGESHVAWASYEGKVA
ncbi:6-carboxytetrahydropterin synthase [Porifericola rhodea]|uniref:6-pyruvoyl trahydropterin synthase family protein n=1 Tax=Porifericola rhodea TaxID=930972 RepID=UPI0026662EC6|nr:6-carboxytetrahydropterin synthase [Porifericola rhodea]WKN31914.1 6-carboxytetrahydropterin synthase [Porifericola rhodea]